MGCLFRCEEEDKMTAVNEWLALRIDIRKVRVKIHIHTFYEIFHH